ncbi:MAG: alkaline phosphatase family protein [Methylovulum sp.]|uniref:alkaline phosphatase family protein n=1 Tax=Methylovulum sp. TaxID=1916980 RepID=UPI00260ABF35|nr:alkaline phosphatase family protein [Methylovulum sp.]MDD2722795.1 alkaline phosphatase family protein [Methylovulum sp.]MDD5124913.1 alkaline phosphatase family protein [Methylovulum sp.]
MNGKKSFFYSSLALGVALAINSSTALATAPVTATPIQHLIVVIGENVAFDTLYGAYKPAKGQAIKNLLSTRIINADGTPGVNFAKALQREGSNLTKRYDARPVRGAPYAALPQPLQTGILDPSTFTFVGGIPDPRFPADLPNGPFQITKYVPYGSANSATGDPAHRFFQMWQQTGGNNRDHSLFTWVATTTGTGGDNGPNGPKPGDSQQGGELMGFFNMSQGDAPIFKQLAQNYALSDNFHQSIMGGTGANFFSIATADVAIYNNAGVLTPPANQIENPSPLAGTENFYTQDGYAGGSYVKCSDAKQPGVRSILRILETQNRASNCAKDAFYLVNNYDVPYNVDGSAKTLGPTQFVYPPQTVPTIGEALSAKDVSWKWYTAGRDTNDILNDELYPYIHALVDKQVPIDTPNRAQVVDAITFSNTRTVVYNSIGDPHNASANVVTTPALRDHLKGMETFLSDVSNETLPAVSFVVPKNLVSGHPGYSAPVRYELFIKDLVESVQAKPALWANTAIIVTTDEGGGYFDSGVIQNLDFFGDGPRIPMLVVSPYAKKGFVDHVYHDHASILKFIEHNWGLNPLSARSRDNLPNPVAGSNPYLPANQPAIGDMTSLFDFPAP